MRRSAKMLYFPVLMFMAISSSFFGAENIAPKLKANLCILSLGSEFKTNLINALLEDSNVKRMDVTLDSISNCSKYPASNYNVVIILSCVQGFKPFVLASDYIISNNYSGNIIYFSTYSLFNLPYGPLDAKRIDAITSASTATDKKVLDDATNKIIAKVNNILKAASGTDF